METFSVLLVLGKGNPPVTGGFPSQRPVTRGFDVFSDVIPDIRLSKQTRCWWFEPPWRSFWRHFNEIQCYNNWKLIWMALAVSLQFEEIFWKISIEFCSGYCAKMRTLGAYTILHNSRHELGIPLPLSKISTICHARGALQSTGIRNRESFIRHNCL